MSEYDGEERQVSPLFPGPSYSQPPSEKYRQWRESSRKEIENFQKFLRGLLYYDGDPKDAPRIMNEIGVATFSGQLAMRLNKYITLTTFARKDVEERLYMDLNSLTELIVKKGKEWECQMAYWNVILDMCDDLMTGAFNRSIYGRGRELDANIPVYSAQKTGDDEGWKPNISSNRR